MENKSKFVKIARKLQDGFLSLIPEKENLKYISQLENLIEKTPKKTLFNAESLRTINGKTDKHNKLDKNHLLDVLSTFTIGGGSYKIVHKKYHEKNDEKHVINITKTQTIHPSRNEGESWPPNYNVQSILFIDYVVIK